MEEMFYEALKKHTIAEVLDAFRSAARRCSKDSVGRKHFVKGLALYDLSEALRR